MLCNVKSKFLYKSNYINPIVKMSPVWLCEGTNTINLRGNKIR